MVEVRKAFGEQQVLDGFSIEVPDGGVTSVIGPSGAGKSTLLKCIIGLVSIDSGEVWVDEERVDGFTGSELYELRRKVGFVFQFAALFDSMTLAENVAMGLRRIPGLSAGEIDERVEEALALVDLQGSEGKYPSELSGGMQKRAGVARAVALRPQYLLYDEPTTGLDPLTVTMVNRLILKMRDELDVTSLIITHDMDSARSVSNRIALLHEGRVRWEGDPEELDRAEDPVVRGFVEGKPELLEEAS